MPNYRAGVPTETFAQRRAAYIGSVGAGFFVVEMLANLPGVEKGVRTRLYEGGPEPIVKQANDVPATDAGNLLFDNADQQHQPTADSKSQARNAGNGLRHVQWFTLAERIWVVEVSAPFTERVGSLDRALPVIMLLSGIVISATLAGVLLGLLRARTAAGTVEVRG